MNNILTSFPQIMAYVGYILLAILVLLLMITVHELGHYFAGKILGFRIDEFSIGFGPKLYQKKKKDGELFSVRLFPFGGFCAFHGEDKESKDENDFNSKPPWKRIIVLLSGVTMNYIFALLIIGLMFGIYGKTALMSYETVDNPSVGYDYKLKDKDVFLSIEGNSIYMVNDLMNSVSGREKGDTVCITVLRDGEEKTVKLALNCDTHFENVEDTEKLYRALGLYYETDANGKMTYSGLYSTTLKMGFVETLGKTFVYSGKLATSIFDVLGQLFSGRLGIGSLGGTVTTVSVAADAIKIGGFRYLLNISAFIGVNLALFNALPIPALDGSRVVFAIIEWIRKKPVDRKIENIVHTIGFVIIIAFAVFVDVQQFFV